MPSGQLVKAWSISPNVRNVFTTMIDMAGWFIFKNHEFLITKGWTVIGTSNGVTAAFDGGGGDRIISAAAASVRGASAAAPQSWTVLRNADLVEILITYQGAGASPTGDDIIRISYSPAAHFVLAVTTTHQPTATDEVVISAANSVVNATASLDRVMTIWASDDSKHWSCAIFRSAATLGIFGVERLAASYCATGILDVPYFGYRYTATSQDRTTTMGTTPNGDVSATAVGGGGWSGTCSRVFTNLASRLIRVGAGDLFISSTAGSTPGVSSEVFTTSTPTMHGSGCPLIPLIWSGELSANLSGFFGTPLDWWWTVTTSLTLPTRADFLPGYEPADIVGVDPQRTNWLVALGSCMIRPWRNAAATFQVT
jgi:hypothetical protein